MTYRGRIRTGAMRHRIKIEECSTTADSAGQPTRTWSTLATVPAAVRTVSAGETFRGRQILEGVTKLFTIRPIDFLDNEDRITYAGKVYGIASIIEPEYDGGNRWIEIQGRYADD